MPAKSALHQVFCSNVKSRRIEIELTQTALGERLGMSHSAISQVESGVSVPGLLLMEKIAAALGITVPELLTAHETAEV